VRVSRATSSRNSSEPNNGSRSLMRSAHDLPSRVWLNTYTPPTATNSTASRRTTFACVKPLTAINAFVGQGSSRCISMNSSVMLGTTNDRRNRTTPAATTVIMAG